MIVRGQYFAALRLATEGGSQSDEYRGIHNILTGP